MPGQVPATSSRRHVFGPFVLDEASGELRKHGVRIRIQGQPLQILVTLLRRPGGVVTREEIQQQLWSDSTFVDFEHGVNAAVNRLRQALGDAAGQPRYVETLPGKGYRFVAAVQAENPGPVLVMATSSEEPVPQPSPVQPPHTQGSSKRRLFWMLAAGLAAGLLLGYWGAARRSGSAATQPLRFSVSPPAGFALEAGSSRQTFALSPDGTRLAFTAMDASGIFQAFVRDLNALDSRQLPNTAGAYHVFWSPDGGSLFLTVAGSLRRTSLQADSYQAICDIPSIFLTGAVMGSNLLLSARTGNFQVPASGGKPQAVKESMPWPQVLPDGKHVLFTSPDVSRGSHRVQVMEFGRPETVRDLLEADSRAVYTPSLKARGTGYLVYVRAGNLLAQPFNPESLSVRGEPLALASQIYSFFPTGAADFSASDNGSLAYRRYMSRSQLGWVNRKGEVLATIGPENVNLKQGRLSPDGKKIATAIFDVSRGVNALWIVDAKTGAARRAVIERGWVDNPVWSPDSNRLVFNYAYESAPKLFLRGLGDRDATEALPEGYFQVPNDWSADGRFLAFTNSGFAPAQNEMQGDVWLVDMARNRKVIHLIQTQFHEANPAFSPDGRWLAFMSDESGRAEVYVQAFVAGEDPRLVGERILVSRRGAAALRWRRDGRELFYLGADGRVYSVPVTPGSKVRVGAEVPLFAISTEARAAIHALSGFDVSPDGERFLIPIVKSAERSEIVVMQNWESEQGRPGGLPHENKN